MPHRDHSIWVVAWEAIQPYLNKIFYIFIGGVLQVYLSSKRTENMSKKAMLAIFVSAVFVGWLASEIVTKIGWDDYAGIAAAIGALSSMSIVQAIDKNAGSSTGKIMSAATDWITKFFKK